MLGESKGGGREELYKHYLRRIYGGMLGLGVLEDVNLGGVTDLYTRVHNSRIPVLFCLLSFAFLFGNLYFMLVHIISSNRLAIYGAYILVPQLELKFQKGLAYPVQIFRFFNANLKLFITS